MVRTYINKKAKLNTENVKAAVALVKTGISIRKSAKQYDISRTTLRDYVLKDKEGVVFKLASTITQQVFTIEMEKDLVEYLLISSAMFYGLTPKNARSLAYEFAKANEVKYPKSWNDNNIAGKEWMNIFLKRHNELSIRTPEATSLARMTSFNRTNVQTFYGKLEDVILRYEFGASSIYNLDETGCTTVQRVPRIIGKKGLHQVGLVTSRERGELITFVGIICAHGNALPPAFIFPRVRYDAIKMMSNVPKEALGLVYPSGWMTADNFIRVLEHFVKHTKCTKENPVLLLLDNHETHSSLAAINLARSNGIVILTIPPHTSNKLQPLDKTVYGPFKTFYSSRMTQWLANHPGKTISIFDIPQIACSAWDQSATPCNIKAGFRSTGIFPLDKDLFSDADFMCSEVTNRPEPSSSQLLPEPSLLSIPISQVSPPILETSYSSSQLLPEPSLLSIPISQVVSPPTLETSYISPQLIRPYPKAAERKSNNSNRQRGKCMIATDTPEKEEIELKKKGKEKKTCKKRSLFKKHKEKSKQVPLSSSSSEEDIFALYDDTTSGDEEEFLFDKETCNLTPQISSFVIVSFGEIFYIGEILSDKNEANDYEISYLRKSTKVKHSFVYPNERELMLVNQKDIKAVLPMPVMQSTKRRSAFKKFPVNFGSLNLR